jgi:hypothetical protein
MSENPPIGEQMQKAFDFAADLAKQLITLASGIIAVVITFFEKSTSPGTSPVAVSTLKIPLLIYLSSIVLGVGALMALTGVLAENKPSATPNSSNARLFSGLQIIAFLIATAWMIWVVA